MAGHRSFVGPLNEVKIVFEHLSNPLTHSEGETARRWCKSLPLNKEYRKRRDFEESGHPKLALVVRLISIPLQQLRLWKVIFILTFVHLDLELDSILGVTITYRRFHSSSHQLQTRKVGNKHSHGYGIVGQQHDGFGGYRTRCLGPLGSLQVN